MGLPSSFTNECFSKCNINKSEGTAQGNQRNAPCFHSSLTAYNIHHRFRHAKPLLIEYIPFTENPITQTLTDLLETKKQTRSRQGQARNSDLELWSGF